MVAIRSRVQTIIRSGSAKLASMSPCTSAAIPAAMKPRLNTASET